MSVLLPPFGFSSSFSLIKIYEFLVEDMPDKVDPVLHQKILDAGELKGKIIATNTTNELCRLTMEIFAGVPSLTLFALTCR
jgi:hypothetical protein